MEFRRKILSDMKSWKESGLCREKALLIKGLRQVGKTHIVKQFASENYENVIYIDFRSDKTIRSVFSGDFDIDDIILNISALRNDARFVPGKTVIIFDEVQDCADARSSVKYFVQDGRFDIIETGSLLSVNGYNRRSGRGIPVGFEHTLHLRPMDFEEFLWAKGTSEEILSSLRKSFLNRSKIGPVIEQSMIRSFREYLCVGGMPHVVSTFLRTNNINDVRSDQKDLIEQYRDDFGRYLDKDENMDIDSRLQLAIANVFDSIPAQLAKENKKFQFSKIPGKMQNNQYRDAIEWLKGFGLIDLSYNLKTLDAPLEGNKDLDCFKIYLSDTGLYMAMLDDDVYANIMNGSLGIYKGAVYENIIADAFTKMGRSLYYYQRNNRLEIDFITRYQGKTVLIEVKARDGRSKSARTVLDEKHEDVERCFKFKESGIGESGDITTLPQYMAFLLTD